MSLLTNRADAVKVLSKGDASVGGYMSPGSYWALPQAEIEKIHGYEPYSDAGLAEAKKLLSAAGVQDGLSVVLLTRALIANSENISLFVAEQLGKVGLKAKSDVVETAIAYDRLNKRDFDLVPWVQGIALDDPDAIFAESYLTGAPRNYSQLSSPAVDALFLKQSQELDPAKRLEMVKEMQRLALPEFSKIIMYYSNAHAVVNKAVQGYVLHNTSYNSQRHEDLWLNA